jgi:hypothetical protein
LPEGVPKGSQLPDGSLQISAANGPLHHYMFELYALDTRLDVKPSSDAFETRASVVKAIQDHILARAVYGGLFRRPQFLSLAEREAFAQLEVELGGVHWPHDAA